MDKGDFYMYDIISIERECGSAGNYIAKKLSTDLGYKLLDHNVLVEASKKMGLPAIYIKDLEETSPGSIIFNLAKYATSEEPLSDKLFRTEKEIIQEQAKKGPCIVLGRCGGEIFGEDVKVLRIFIHADREFRIAKTMVEKSMTRSEAETEVKKGDKRRKDFYNFHTGKVWAQPDNFELIIDSGKLGIDMCVQIIKAMNEFE